MPQDTSESLTLKEYDLLKQSIPTLNNLPKSQRFLLSDRILNLLSDLLETIIEAYYAPQHEKRPLLNRVNLILEKLRYFIAFATTWVILTPNIIRNLRQNWMKLGA